ncbi:heavy metal translocating P-type ATPase [Apibacter adventoris]|uniref:heavy metal translocating P-type ATPase n=1 Tax=Apibacter adventoris TaxID=1679466 RepID=UPI000CF6511F|nr:heavy metal translocating P-type ATPase [Apibacter adventoris]PQL94937.1 cadmium-translocating P-type ATPase [Apibacter adventoris]
MCTHNHSECCSSSNDNKKNGEDHNYEQDTGIEENTNILKLFLPAIISFILLIAAIILDYFDVSFFHLKWIKLVWYLIAYFPVGYPVFKEMCEEFKNKDFFNEFSLMFLASVGAFYIGEYPEAVAVMLFYSIGENFQDLAVSRAKKNINSLLDQRPDVATVLENDNSLKVFKAKEIQVGSVLQLKPGEKVALDGELISSSASFNTSALTGESAPQTKEKGDIVLAGMINLNTISQIKVTTPYSDSKLSKILNLIQNSNSQKAKTELFIRKFAKIYTPAVFFIALLVFIVPYFVLQNYNYQTWLYRSLIFLVISCPCALVISIPLGYFGGVGLASRNGILIKGSYFLDILVKIRQVVFDKTGTLTQGNFIVQNIHVANGFEKDKILDWVNITESGSTHPIANAIREQIQMKPDVSKISYLEDIPGKGIKAEIEGNEILVGNFKLLDLYHISYDENIKQIVNTLVLISVNNKFAGYIEIADQLKPDVKKDIGQLHALGIGTTVLSGDKNTIVQEVAKEVGIDQAFGDLLPEDKVIKMKEIKKQTEGMVAFVGDGFNDAPVIALSDVGIAMGGLGSDATIEVADIIIQDDKTAKVPLAIRIGKATKKIVWQNIILAFGVKLLVMILGLFGDANLLEAVFADVGVALLAILNAVRLQNMKIRLF